MTDPSQSYTSHISWSFYCEVTSKSACKVPAPSHYTKFFLGGYSILSETPVGHFTGWGPIFWSTCTGASTSLTKPLMVVSPLVPFIEKLVYKYIDMHQNGQKLNPLSFDFWPIPQWRGASFSHNHGYYTTSFLNQLFWLRFCFNTNLCVGTGYSRDVIIRQRWNRITCHWSPSTKPWIFLIYSYTGWL